MGGGRVALRRGLIRLAQATGPAIIAAELAELAGEAARLAAAPAWSAEDAARAAVLARRSRTSCVWLGASGLDLDRGLSCGGDRRGEVERLGACHAEAGAQLAKRGVDSRERGRGAPRHGLAEIPTPKALEPEDRFRPFRTVVAG